MVAAETPLARANALHRAKRFNEAEARYLSLLESNPGHAEGLHQLGLLHAQTQRPDTAIQLLRAAIGIEGPSHALCRNLGIVLQREGNQAAALACYRQALADRPEDVTLWQTVAEILSGMERFEESAEAWQRVISGSPGKQIIASVQRANALALAGRRSEAIGLYDRVLADDPRNVEACFHRAVALMQMDRCTEASVGFARTLELDPFHARAANNAGILLQMESEYKKAIQSYRRAIRADRTFTAAIYNLGTAWQESDRPREAVCVLRKVVRVEPGHTDAWTNLGNAWLGLNRVGKAESCYRQALALHPEAAAASWNLGISLLLQGQWDEGWRSYERRFDVPGATPRRTFDSTLWDGSNLTGKSVLLHAEQGFGDTLQFVRYANVLAAHGARVAVECQRELLPILASLTAISEWIAAPANDFPPTDFQLPLLSAPALCGTTARNVPLAEGYLKAPAEAARRWKRWLGPRGFNRRVGIAWAGNPKHKNDRRRSIRPELLGELSSAKNTEWISLQKGHAVPGSLPLWNAAQGLTDFADTAGLIENLDLVVSVDTSVAHLAGALGKPVWILLPFAPDWRWQLTGSTTPWYNSARLFRQKERGGWPAVLREVLDELGRFGAS